MPSTSKVIANANTPSLNDSTRALFMPIFFMAARTSAVETARTSPVSLRAAIVFSCASSVFEPHASLSEVGKRRKANVAQLVAFPASGSLAEVPRKPERDRGETTARLDQWYGRRQQAKQLRPTVQKRYRHKPIP